MPFSVAASDVLVSGWQKQTDALLRRGMTMDWGAIIGLISLALAIPLGVASIFVYRCFERTLEQRKLTKSNESRQQAIREYDLIKELYNGKRDK